MRGVGYGLSPLPDLLLKLKYLLKRCFSVMYTILYSVIDGPTNKYVTERSSPQVIHPVKIPFLFTILHTPCF